MANTKPSSSFLGITDANDGWVPIATSSASAATSLEFTSDIDGTYDMYRIEGLFDQSVDGSAMELTVSHNNGSTYVTSNYSSIMYGYSANNQNKTFNDSADSALRVTTNFDTDVAQNAWFQVDLLNPGATGDIKLFRLEALMFDNTTTNSQTRYFGGGRLLSGDPVTNTINAIKLTQTPSGNFTGNAWLFGKNRT